MAKKPAEHETIAVTSRLKQVIGNGGRSIKTRATTPVIVSAAVVLLACGAIGYLTYDRLRLQRQVNDLSQAAPQQPVDETAQLTAKISNLIELPTDETPTVATVTDVSKVQDKPFFTRAQNGDKVLLYAKSGKALLYRPATNKLIEVSTLNLEADQQAATPAPAPKKK